MAALVWAQHRVARHYINQGLPQVAAFSFDHIGIRINAFGRYERDELNALMVFMRGRGLLRGACLDIGANIGNHSLFFSDHFEKVHSFEPGPDTFELLRINAALRGNIVCHNFGLSDCTRDAFWSTPTHNIGAGAIGRDADATVLQRTAIVKLIELDSLKDIQDLEIGLIKIDVEGHESAVIDGASVTIARTKPVIVFEQQPQEMKGGSSPTIDRLRALGYTEFLSFARKPQTRSRILTGVLRLLRGESHSFESLKFTSQFYSMIVAIA